MQVVVRLNVSFLDPTEPTREAKGDCAIAHIDRLNSQPDVSLQMLELVTLMWFRHAGCTRRHIWQLGVGAQLLRAWWCCLVSV
jgi:hypothetical protein